MEMLFILKSSFLLLPLKRKAAPEPGKGVFIRAPSIIQNCHFISATKSPWCCRPSCWWLSRRRNVFVILSHLSTGRHAAPRTLWLPKISGKYVEGCAKKKRLLLIQEPPGACRSCRRLIFGTFTESVQWLTSSFGIKRHMNIPLLKELKWIEKIGKKLEEIEKYFIGKKKWECLK